MTEWTGLVLSRRSEVTFREMFDVKVVVVHNVVGAMCWRVPWSNLSFPHTCHRPPLSVIVPWPAVARL